MGVNACRKGQHTTLRINARSHARTHDYACISRCAALFPHACNREEKFMPTINVSNKSLAVLDRYALFGGSREAVLETIIDFFETNSIKTPLAHEGAPMVPAPPASPHEEIPNLRHTRIISVEVDGIRIKEHEWNNVLQYFLIKYKDQIPDADAARKIFLANFMPGKFEERAYKYVPEVGLSFQMREAKAVWKSIVHAAPQLGIKVSVDFVWPNVKGSAFPGKHGKLFA